MTKSEDTLVGMWFHSFDKCEQCGQNIVQWQGQIVARVDLPETTYLVQFYEWIFGDSTNRELVLLKQMVGWKFYPTNEDMRGAFERNESHRLNSHSKHSADALLN